jgi:hypothetical protein
MYFSLFFFFFRIFTYFVIHFMYYLKSSVLPLEIFIFTQPSHPWVAQQASLWLHHFIHLSIRLFYLFFVYILHWIYYISIFNSHQWVLFLSALTLHVSVCPGTLSVNFLSVVSAWNGSLPQTLFWITFFSVGFRFCFDYNLVYLVVPVPCPLFSFLWFQPPTVRYFKLYSELSSFLWFQPPTVRYFKFLLITTWSCKSYVILVRNLTFCFLYSSSSIYFVLQFISILH